MAVKNTLKKGLRKLGRMFRGTLRSQSEDDVRLLGKKGRQTPTSRTPTLRPLVHTSPGRRKSTRSPSRKRVIFSPNNSTRKKSASPLIQFDSPVRQSIVPKLSANSYMRDMGSMAYEQPMAPNTLDIQNGTYVDNDGFVRPIMYDTNEIDNNITQLCSFVNVHRGKGGSKKRTRRRKRIRRKK
jgi:hypothetical protein